MSAKAKRAPKQHAPAKPTVTGTKRVIESYLRNGGTTMDEAHYQAYKLALLTSWLDTLYPVAGDAGYVCLDCDRTKLLSVDDAIRHLRVHNPEWFQS